MTQTLIEFLIKLLAWAAPFTLRKAYPPKRIGDLIKVRISADSEGIEFWNGDTPKAKAWITITNLSPFSLELDRAFGSFSYGAELEKFSYLQKEKILPASETSFPIETSLTKEQAGVINRLRASSPSPEVLFNAHILCNVHNFDLHKSLRTTHHRLVNFNATQ